MAQEWISVKDRLPSVEDGIVQVALDAYGTKCRHGSIDTDQYGIHDWVRWMSHVTHWMPLPEPPKEEE